jgi:hypothetical protein
MIRRLMKMNGKKDEKASHGTTLPREILELWGWKQGDKIQITPNKEKETLTLKKTK